MNKLVAASASVGWTKTLFSRHSTLNAGLPAATCTTGSPTSMTVRWLSAVFRCTMRVRSLVWVSIICATAGITTAASTANINTTRLMACLFLSLVQCCTSRRLPPKSPGRLWLVGFQQRRDISRWELRPPLGVGKDHLPIAYFAASRLDRELADSLKNNWRAFLVAVGEHFPHRRDLCHEDQAFNDLAIGLREGLDQKDPPFRVDLHLAVAQAGNFHGDRTATGSLRNLVNDLLWKAVEDDRSGPSHHVGIWSRPSIPANDRVQGRQIGQSSPILAAAPFLKPIDQRLQLFSRPLFVSVQGSASLVAPEEELLASLGVVLVCLDLGISFLQFRQKLLATAHDFGHSAPVVPVDHEALLINLRGKALSSDHSPKITQARCGSTPEEPPQLLAREVVQSSDLIVAIDFNVLVHVFDPAFLFQLQPRCRGHIVADVTNDLLIGLRSMLQLIQRILKLVHQLPCQVWPSFRQTRSLQIGYCADLISAGLHRNLRKVPPGTRGFGVLFLRGGVLFLVGEPVFDEPWKSAVLDQAHHIEVKIPAVSGSGFRMKDQRASQLQLLASNGSDTFRRKLAPMLFEVLSQQANGVLN